MQPATEREPAATASFRGQEVRVMASSQEQAGNRDSGLIEQWKGSRLTDSSGNALTFDDPQEAAERPQESVRAPAAANPAPAAHDDAAETPPAGEIRDSAQQARRGGILSIIKALVNALKGLFMPAPAAAGNESIRAEPPKQGSPWTQAVKNLEDALQSFDEVREQVTNQTAELVEDAAELKEALRQTGAGHPLKGLLGPAQAMEVLQDRKNALGVLESRTDMSTGQKERSAKGIRAGASIISRLMETRYAPVTRELRPLAEAPLRAFENAGGENPYLKMHGSDKFSRIEDANVRKWLGDALSILDSAGRLIIESAAGKGSDIDINELQGQLKSFQRQSAAQKAFAHADLIRSMQ